MAINGLIDKYLINQALLDNPLPCSKPVFELFERMSPARVERVLA